MRIRNGGWKVITQYRAESGIQETTKDYWHMTTAESHYNLMIGKPGVYALYLMRPDGSCKRSWVLPFGVD